MGRGSLVDAVVAETVDDIIAGRLREGTMLPPEPKLSSRFQVSRTVVREAMVRLAHMGLVRIRQGAGTVIQARANWNELDPELLRIRAASGLIGDLVPDLLEIRRMVEVEVAGYAAQRRSEDDLASMVGLMDVMLANTHDPAAYSNADVAFHEALIVASRNELLRQMMRPVNQVRCIGSVITASRDPSVITASMVGHQEIFDAVAARDVTSARKAMESHIAQFERDISEALRTASQETADEAAGRGVDRLPALVAARG